MAFLRDWRLATALAFTAVVAILRLAAYDDPGEPIQVAMQVLMPVPLVVGALACLPAIRRDVGRGVAGLVFLAAFPALLYAWTEHHPRTPGDEFCSAKGFVPQGWGDSLEPYVVVVLPVVALIAAIAGVVLAWRPATRQTGFWFLAAAAALLVTWFAAPVCVGT